MSEVQRVYDSTCRMECLSRHTAESCHSAGDGSGVSLRVACKGTLRKLFLRVKKKRQPRVVTRGEAFVSKSFTALCR